MRQRINFLISRITEQVVLGRFHLSDKRVNQEFARYGKRFTHLGSYQAPADKSLLNYP